MIVLAPTVIHRVTTLALRVQPWTWRFADERREDIDKHFAAQRREKPQLWNGRILLGRNAAFTEKRFSAGYFEAAFACFVA